MRYYLAFLVILFLYTVKYINAYEVSYPTNYTKSYLESNSQVIKCESKEDCPLGYLCESQTKTCYFKSFICMDDRNTNCVFFKDNVYDVDTETLIQFGDIDLKKYEKPILKSCYKEELETGHCKTDSCYADNDCYSGKCYNNICMTDKDIYTCYNPNSRNATDVVCDKLSGMKCDSNDECHSNICNEDGYCDSLISRNLEESFLILFTSAYIVWTIIVLCLLVLGCLLCCCCCCCF